MTRAKTSPITILFLAAIFVLVGTIILFPGRSEETSEEIELSKVAATIYPIYDIVRGVSGNDLHVILALPPGSSPHTFEPSPSQMGSLKGAKMVFAVGYGMDKWAEQMAEAAGVSVVTLDRNVDLIMNEEDEHHDEADHEDGDEHEDEEEHEHEHGPVDPHYWLDPGNIRTMAETVRQELSIEFPEMASEFAANMADYIQSIDMADAKAKILLSSLTERGLVTLHGAWGYFARAYGLEMIGSFEPSAGKEPTPRYLAELTEAVRKSGTKTIYGEPQLSMDSLQPFMEDNGLTLAILDPLGGYPGRETLAELIVYNAQTINQNQ